MVEMMSKVPFEVNPGDVIAFSGNGIDSKIIRWFTQSLYSHIIIVLDTQRPNPNSEDTEFKDVLIAESTTYTTVPNFNGQQCIQGVQVHWLSHWLDIYKTYGRAWWFPLKQQLSPEGITQMQSWLWHLYEHQVPFSCPKSVGAWMARERYHHNYDALKQQGLSTDSLSFFCSELVTQALQVAGAIDPKLNPAAQTPKDVMNLTCFQDPQPIQL